MKLISNAITYKYEFLNIKFLNIYFNKSYQIHKKLYNWNIYNIL